MAGMTAFVMPTSRYEPLNGPQDRCGSPCTDVQTQSCAVITVTMNLLAHLRRLHGPKCSYWKADEKFQDIARMLGYSLQLQKKRLKRMPKQFTILVKQLESQWASKALESMKKLGKTACMKLPCLWRQCSPANPLPMVADMEESWQMLTMVMQNVQDVVNNRYQPRGRSDPVSFL